jgi:hypothetical protein
VASVPAPAGASARWSRWPHPKPPRPCVKQTQQGAELAAECRSVGKGEAQQALEGSLVGCPEALDIDQVALPEASPDLIEAFFQEIEVRDEADCVQRGPDDPWIWAFLPGDRGQESKLCRVADRPAPAFELGEDPPHGLQQRAWQSPLEQALDLAPQALDREQPKGRDVDAVAGGQLHVGRDQRDQHPLAGIPTGDHSVHSDSPRLLAGLAVDEVDLRGTITRRGPSRGQSFEEMSGQCFQSETLARSGLLHLAGQMAVENREPRLVDGLGRQRSQQFRHAQPGTSGVGSASCRRRTGR